jgi:hypothetical protein
MSERRGACRHAAPPLNTRAAVGLIFLLSVPLYLDAQVPSDTADTASPVRRTASHVATIGVVGGTLAYSAGVWWVNDFRPFHYTVGPWFEDKLGIDKLGHMFTSYAMFRSIHDLLTWGGDGPERSFWWAAGIAAFHGLAVEIGDGYSRYGFDYHDLTFNYIGLGFGMARESVPFLRNFDLKWSLYYPLNRHAFKINALYDYHIYWVSLRVHELLPEGWSRYWPPVLAVAFGLGADENVTVRTYCLSLDYNLEALPVAGRDLGLLMKLLNLFHLPAPGVKFSKGYPPQWQVFLLN